MFSFPAARHTTKGVYDANRASFQEPIQNRLATEPSPEAAAAFATISMPAPTVGDEGSAAQRAREVDLEGEPLRSAAATEGSFSEKPRSDKYRFEGRNRERIEGEGKEEKGTRLWIRRRRRKGERDRINGGRRRNGGMGRFGKDLDYLYAWKWKRVVGGVPAAGRRSVS